jgi:hypothetical protein
VVIVKKEVVSGINNNFNIIVEDETQNHGDKEISAVKVASVTRGKGDGQKF